MEYIVNYFLSARGERPVKLFILEQDRSTTAKIIHLISGLKKLGLALRMPYARKLERNLYELRVLGKNNIRIFYCVKEGEYYLLHVFKKKTQKTPQKELKIALERRNQII